MRIAESDIIYLTDLESYHARLNELQSSRTAPENPMAHRSGIRTISIRTSSTWLEYVVRFVDRKDTCERPRASREDVIFQEEEAHDKAPAPRAAPACTARTACGRSVDPANFGINAHYSSEYMMRERVRGCPIRTDTHDAFNRRKANHKTHHRHRWHP
ncbi:MAG: hypothetical protein PWR17_709 [Candidatus Methanomethylophilaceae archaeon]|nr:hypothetical protein [Candidatus Methanomethylophilaceae archaeon]